MAKNSPYVVRSAYITIPSSEIEGAINNFITEQLGTSKFNINDIDLRNKADSHVYITLT